MVQVLSRVFGYLDTVEAGFSACAGRARSVLDGVREDAGCLDGLDAGLHLLEKGHRAGGLDLHMNHRLGGVSMPVSLRISSTFR